MKTFNTTQITKTLMVAVIGGLMLANIGCGNNKTKEASVADARGVRGGSSDVSTMGTPVGQAVQMQRPAEVVGRDQVSFMAEIDGLLSSILSKSDYGDVSYQSGLRIRGLVELDNQGNVIASGTSSAIVLTVEDSYVGKVDEESGEVYDAISIQVPARSGRAYNGQFQVTFADEYGSISVSGTWMQSGQMTGTVSYQNNSTTGSAKSSGTLGNFSMPVCNFFKCLTK